MSLLPQNLSQDWEGDDLSLPEDLLLTNKLDRVVTPLSIIYCSKSRQARLHLREYLIFVKPELFYRVNIWSNSLSHIYYRKLRQGGIRLREYLITVTSELRYKIVVLKTCEFHRKIPKINCLHLRRFPVIFVKFFKRTILYSTSEQLLLYSQVHVW